MTALSLRELSAFSRGPHAEEPAEASAQAGLSKHGAAPRSRVYPRSGY
jgi:hypothetical protein